MMDDEMKRILKGPEVSPLHQALLDHCLQLLKKSRSSMSNHYKEWDKRHEVYMRRRPPDSEDVEAVKQGLPRKIIVPMTYSQVTTAVAFGYLLFTQRERFYEYKGVSDQDTTMRECAERLVQRDLLSSDYKRRLVQTLLDVCVPGLAVEKDWWEVDYINVPVERVADQPMYNGQPTGPTTYVSGVERLKKREGNKIRTISPYRFYCDPAHSLVDWRRGRFVATLDEYTRSALRTMEAEGAVIGVNEISDTTPSKLANWGFSDVRLAALNVNQQNQDVVMLTEMILEMAPAEIKDRDGRSLGSETLPHKWVIWIANDQRVIRAEPLTYLHGQWPVSTCMFMPDQHEAMTNSLAYMIDDIQGLISWFMNSRMAAVSRTIDNQVVVDETGIDMKTVATRARIIRMLKQASGKDVRRYFMPIETRDSTQGHVTDMQNLTSVLQLVSGVNDNAMGQVATGRRSATENRAANTGAASRMRMIFDVVWDMHYQPQANRLLTNHRQFITQEEFALVCGEEKAYYYEQFKSQPEVLVRAYDFVAFDGTLPSEKLFLAQQLSELLMQLLANPMAAAAFNMDPNKVQKEIMELRGLGRGTQFGYDQVPQNLIAALMMQQGPPQLGNGPPGQNTARTQG